MKQDNEQDPRVVRTRLLEALALKELPREGWRRVGIPSPESVAGHSWGVAWLVLVLCPEDVDRERALAMAILHDLAEVRVGDITPHDGVSATDKHTREEAAIVSLLEGIDPDRELIRIWREFESRETPTARFVRHCDKLDMALQANRYAQQHGADTREFVDSALEQLAESVLAPLVGSES